MARRRQLQRFRVHLWHGVSVTDVVLAEDHESAIDAAFLLRDYHDAFLDVGGLNTAYNEDYSGACVDVVGDVDYALTCYFESRTNVLYEPVRQLLDSLDDKAATQKHVAQLRELLRKFV